MRLLLDTQAFLWMAAGSARVPDAVRAALRSPENDVWLSVVSVWEIAIKSARGRLTLPGSAVEYAGEQRRRHAIGPLALEETAVAHLAKLPALHGDPFDRMLICQAIEHDLTIVTNDAVVQRYPVKTIWASTVPSASSGQVGPAG
jgi:PIN domain nuclease of toxin-antitoxin system